MPGLHLQQQLHQNLSSPEENHNRGPKQRRKKGSGRKPRKPVDGQRKPENKTGGTTQGG
jgi:hypothetical protein